MASSIISQFKREYNAPIETLRQVNSISERDSINSAVRWEGMLVYVNLEETTYELKGGIDNTNWEPIAGLSDAPEDGNSYVRKNGNWEIASFTEEVIDFAVTVTDIINPATIEFNSWRSVKVGNRVTMTGAVQVDGATTTFGTPAAVLSFSGFPYVPRIFNASPITFMIDYYPGNQSRVARGSFSGIGVLFLNNLSPTSTTGAVSIKNNEWVTGINKSRVHLSITFII